MIVWQTINFFKLASKFCLVDLPGYGFAYAKDEVKEAWEELVSMPGYGFRFNPFDVTKIFLQGLLCQVLFHIKVHLFLCIILIS